MDVDDRCTVTRLPADGHLLAHWTIGRESIWIETSADGTVVVNGEPVMSVEQILSALRARVPAPA